VSPMATNGAERPTVKLRDAHQHNELAHMARILSVQENRTVTMADAVDRLLNTWWQSEADASKRGER